MKGTNLTVTRVNPALSADSPDSSVTAAAPQNQPIRIMNHQANDAPASVSQIKVPIRKTFYSTTEWTLERIDMCAKFRTRAAESPELVAYYTACMKANDVFPPLRIVRIGRIHYLVDGFHRLAAYRAVQAKQATVYVTQGTWKDAMWFALEGNRAHGMPLTDVDMHRVVQIVVQTYPRYSDRWIAELSGASAEFVAWVRMQLGTDDSSQQVGRNRKRHAPDHLVHRPEAHALPLAPNASLPDTLPEQIVDGHSPSCISASNPTSLVHRLLKFGASLRSRITQSRKTTSDGLSPN